jgi:hypothetical protein
MRKPVDATTPDPATGHGISSDEPVAGGPAAGEPVDEPVAGEPVDEQIPLQPVDEQIAGEPVEGVPVLVQARPMAPVTYAALPAVQAVAVAATSFVAGAAALALVRRHAARKLLRSRPVARRPVDMLPVVGSRTFIVDIHLLAKPGE